MMAGRRGALAASVMSAAAALILGGVQPVLGAASSPGPLLGNIVLVGAASNFASILHRVAINVTASQHSFNVTGFSGPPVSGGGLPLPVTGSPSSPSGGGLYVTPPGGGSSSSVLSSSGGSNSNFEAWKIAITATLCGLAFIALIVFLAVWLGRRASPRRTEQVPEAVLAAAAATAAAAAAATSVAGGDKGTIDAAATEVEAKRARAKVYYGGSRSSSICSLGSRSSSLVGESTAPPDHGHPACLGADEEAGGASPDHGRPACLSADEEEGGASSLPVVEAIGAARDLVGNFPFSFLDRIYLDSDVRGSRPSPCNAYRLIYLYISHPSALRQHCNSATGQKSPHKRAPRGVLRHGA